MQTSALADELTATLRWAREVGDRELARETLAELRALRQRGERDELDADLLGVLEKAQREK